MENNGFYSYKPKKEPIDLGKLRRIIVIAAVCGIVFAF